MEHITDSQQRDKALTDIHDMTRMLGAALAFAREERHLEAFRPLDLASLLTSLVDEAHDLGKSATFEGPSSLVIDGQPTALRRAFTNLIDNAIRYGSEANITLVSNGGHVHISITDRGPGIPSAEREAVLKPFSRLESSRSRATGGTGLGLAVVDTVVKRHAGRIQFADREGGGLVVDVNLPVSGNHTDEPHVNRCGGHHRGEHLVEEAVESREQPDHQNDNANRHTAKRGSRVTPSPM